MKLYMMDTGTLRTRARNIESTCPDEPAMCEVPVPFFLIQHPRGNVLFDGGNALEVVNDPVGHWGESAQIFQPLMTAEQSAKAQIESLGVAAESIRYVIQSHLHLDHTGALGQFPNAEVIVHRRELEYAHAPFWFQRAGYVQSDFRRPGINWLAIDEVFGDGFDLFDDGSIRIIFTPGHTPGHQSLIVDLPETGSVVLAGDACNTLQQFDGRGLPSGAYSNALFVQSIDKLRHIVKENDAMFVPGHDLDAWRDFRKAPASYS